MYDFAEEQLLQIVALSLPALLAALSADDVDGFEGLAPHQRQSWFLFLVQLATLAQGDQGPDDALPDDADTWRARLRDLTPDGADTAWALLADDDKPALLQPPVRDPAAAARLQPIATTPDGIDVLITAKNHDVKQARLGAAAPHHWLYALISLQTGQGYLGRGNFGIARMNGGFGSRPLVELVPGLRWGVRVALRQRHLLRAQGAGFSFGPAAGRLLWLTAWDREDSLAVPDLDPAFIEICRRVRLRRDPAGQVTAWGRPSDVMRVDAKDRKGVMDDPWTPVNLSTGGAYTVSAEGFRYDKVADLLFAGDTFKLCPSVQPFADDPEELWVHLSALVRGQGRTEGLHDRILPVRPDRMNRLFLDDQRQLIHRRAGDMLNNARAATRAVRMALLALLQGRSDKINFEDKRERPFVATLTDAIDREFFDHLWRHVDAGSDEARDDADLTWRKMLHDEAKRAFCLGCARLSPPVGRREHNLALAETVFRAVLFKNLPLPQPDEPEKDAA
ncbi:MAG: hypothetical protein P4M00_22015 [Azospirillaceae bacterium]|nr:hypothetical protein [Azospirillaceae bacterium]